MSRSKHTDPRNIRAARRVGAPREERGAGDMSRSRQQLRMLKETGALAKPERGQPEERFAVKPRVIVQKPQAGFHHPASKQEVLEVLNAVGPIAIYGLNSIELTRAPAGRAGAVLAFGSYHVPGRIVLYEQPLPPWRFVGLIAPETSHQLARAGAVLTQLPDVSATLVDWPQDTLCRFMLEEVLLHEIGHHVLQQHTGKRPARIARTRDHEAFAARFAERQRAALLKRRRREG